MDAEPAAGRGAADVGVGASGSVSQLGWEELEKWAKGQEKTVLKVMAAHWRSLSSPPEGFGVLSLEDEDGSERESEPVSAEQAEKQAEVGAPGSGKQEREQPQDGNVEEEQLSPSRTPPDSSVTLDGIPASGDPDEEHPGQDPDGPGSISAKLAAQLNVTENKYPGTGI